MAKHLCPSCGSFVRWALLLCFDCNVKLREADGTQIVRGEHLYPVANVSETETGGIFIA